MGEFTFREFENVTLRAISPCTVGNRQIVANEPILFFKDIKVFGLQEVNRAVVARGGYGNRGWVFWNTTQEIHLQFVRGTMSKEQLAFLQNSRCVEMERAPIEISKLEFLETDEERKFVLSEIPADLMFVYNFETGAKLPFEQVTTHVFRITDQGVAPFTRLKVSYNYEYNKDLTFFNFDKRLYSGYLYFEGETKIKDDITGNITTGILRIPKVKIVSNLQMSIGDNGYPFVLNFDAIGVPVGDRNNYHTIEFFSLSSDIHSDM